MLAGRDKQKGKKITYSLVELLYNNTEIKKKAEYLLKIELLQCKVAFHPSISPSFSKEKKIPQVEIRHLFASEWKHGYGEQRSSSFSLTQPSSGIPPCLKIRALGEK